MYEDTRLGSRDMYTRTRAYTHNTHTHTHTHIHTHTHTYTHNHTHAQVFKEEEKRKNASDVDDRKLAFNSMSVILCLIPMSPRKKWHMYRNDTYTQLQISARAVTVLPSRVSA